MAQTSGQRRTVIDRFRLFSLSEELEPIWLDNVNGDWELYRSSDSQQSRSSRRAKTTKPRETNPPTTTPENQKLSPIVPNAPVKSRKLTRKPDLRRKKLEYTEPEDEQRISIDTGIGSFSAKIAPPSRNDENFAGTKNPEGKQRQMIRQKGRKKLPNFDKENDSSLANRPQTEQGQSSISRQARLGINRSNSITSQNPSKLEGDFAHIRI